MSSSAWPKPTLRPDLHYEDCCPDDDRVDPHENMLTSFASVIPGEQATVGWGDPDTRRQYLRTKRKEREKNRKQKKKDKKKSPPSPASKPRRQRHAPTRRR